jgi:hypothetical protein
MEIRGFDEGATYARARPIHQPNSVNDEHQEERVEFGVSGWAIGRIPRLEVLDSGVALQRSRIDRDVFGYRLRGDVRGHPEGRPIRADLEVTSVHCAAPDPRDAEMADSSACANQFAGSLDESGDRFWVDHRFPGLINDRLEVRRKDLFRNKSG